MGNERRRRIMRVYTNKLVRCALLAMSHSCDLADFLPSGGQNYDVRIQHWIHIGARGAARGDPHAGRIPGNIHGRAANQIP